MTIDDLIKSIVDSNFYRAEIATNCQIGLPQFFMHQNKLCILFLPHVQKPSENGNMLFFTPRYHLTLMQPFRHLLQFSNLTMWNQTEEKPLCIVSVNHYLQHKKQLTALFQMADRLLNAADDNEQAVLLQAYTKQFYDTVSALGIAEVYGGEYGSNRCL